MEVANSLAERGELKGCRRRLHSSCGLTRFRAIGYSWSGDS